MRLRLLLLLVAAAVAGSVGLVSVRRAGEQLAVMHACDAVQAGRWQDALDGTRGRVGDDEVGRAAGECRCRALLATGRGAECETLLEGLLADGRDEGWAPSPDLAVHMIQTLREEGRRREAAELARRAGAIHPEDPDLFYLELLTRSGQEDEKALLDELAGRLAERGPAAVRMRVSLANRYLLRGDPARALAVLGDAPPPEAGDALGLWFDTRGMAQASASDLPGLQRTYARWRAAGGDPDELRARYALTLSIANLADPELPILDGLRRALAGKLDDPKLAEALTIRLVLTLVNAKRFDEALAAYDEGRKRFALEGLTREEVLRAAENQRLAALPPGERHGTLRFRVAGAGPGWTLSVSPEPEAPVDQVYPRLALPPSGVLEVERSLGVAPQRWVLDDADGALRGSGTAFPAAGRTVEVAVTPRPPRAAAHFEPRRRPADGRRRVVWILLDCADWRIARYLLTRGELPVLAAEIERGHRAVLWSDPPLTAAALEAMVWPQRTGLSFVGVLHRFGVELAGLSSVGDNPFGALRWVMPESRDLFATIGAGDLSAANLLFAHGGIHAGRHGEITGPHGERRRVRIGTSARDLSPRERERFPALAGIDRERDAIHVRTIAAEFDDAEALVREGAVDLVALRIEPLDILTHAHFAEAVRSGQDDGAGLLFSLYRYIDSRLGGVHDLLDEDDVFVVTSDHGIRTAMEHAHQALFVATGAGIPPGRSPGTPALRGVSRAIADWLGVATAWPQTGVVPGATALATGTPTTEPASAVR